MQHKQTEPGQWEQALQIMALFNIAITRPLLEVIADAPEFLVSQGNVGVIVIALTALLSVIFPGVLAWTHYFVRKYWPPSGKIYFGVLIGLFLFLIACFGLRRVEGLPGPIIFGYAIFTAVVVAIAYWRLRPVRLFMSYLSVAIIVVPASFVFTGSIWRLSYHKEPLLPGPEIKATIPIVIVFFDELPTTSLVDGEMEIDRTLYPNFGRLAHSSTWFRYASGVSDGTDFAIPAMLTGKYPQLLNASVNDYPNNLFTFLRKSYDMHVYEPWTALYPNGVRDETENRSLFSLIRNLSAVYLHQVVPSEYEQHLPVVQNVFGDFWDNKPGSDSVGRLSYFQSFLKELNGNGRNKLFFLHLMLPHAPWEYLPSGKAYDRHDFGVIFPRTWKNDYWEITQMYQSHLVSVVFVDALLGQLIDRMKSSGLYDEALLIVTADHGFAAGNGFRSIGEKNFAEILYVPLFVKLPHQNTGKVIDRPVETIDIVPTVADLIGTKLTWQHDGLSLLDNSFPERQKQTLYRKVDYTTEASGNPLLRRSLEKHEFQHDRNAILQAIERKIAIFGAHKDVRALFDFADTQGVIGKNIAEVKQLRRDAVSITFRNRDEFDNVDLQSPRLPAIITGRLESKHQIPRFLLGIALDRKICTVTRSIPDDEMHQRFYGLLPETCFQQGKNVLDLVFLDEITGSADTGPLAH